MTSVARGRPLASSRETLADAASELFLEQGYEATTVAHITKRAGVSRSSFFNYFDGKDATIWFALDETLARLAAPVAIGEGNPTNGEGNPTNGEGASNTRGVDLDELASALGAAPPHTLALAITNAEVMGVASELALGRAQRQAALAALLAAEIGRRERHRGPFECEVTGAAQAAAVFAAIWRWADLGAGTHRLDEEIHSALRAVPGAQAAPSADNTRTDVIHADVARGEHTRVQAAGGDIASEERLPAGREAAQRDELRVAVIGTGAIGARVIEELAAGRVAGASLVGVVTRRDDALAEALGTQADTVEDFGENLPRAIAESSLVVECAGIPAVRDMGASVISAGCSLLAVSIGALADPHTREQLSAGPGTLLLATGAVGGLDLLASAARPDGIPGGIEHASITSTKEALSLVQPWMDATEAARLTEAQQPFTLFEGSVAEAVELYPGSLNVACALAHATHLWDDVRVRLVADPEAERTTHEISAAGAAGEYRFVMSNAVSEANPTSSAVVAESVLRAIAELARPSGSFA